MMHFETFEARLVTLKEAKKSDFKEYERQADGYKLCDSERMSIKKQGYYLAVYESNKKMIGLIYICETKNKTIASVDISIPNKCWEMKYGKEALHQFIKCCLERRLYSYICMDEKNRVANAYRAERPKEFKIQYYVINLEELRK